MNPRLWLPKKVSRVCSPRKKETKIAQFCKKRFGNIVIVCGLFLIRFSFLAYFSLVNLHHKCQAVMDMNMVAVFFCDFLAAMLVGVLVFTRP